jgi:hypothetical protein
MARGDDPTSPRRSPLTGGLRAGRLGTGQVGGDTSGSTSSAPDSTGSPSQGLGRNVSGMTHEGTRGRQLSQKIHDLQQDRRPLPRRPGDRDEDLEDRIVSGARPLSPGAGKGPVLNRFGRSPYAPQGTDPYWDGRPAGYSETTPAPDTQPSRPRNFLGEDGPGARFGRFLNRVRSRLQ